LFDSERPHPNIKHFAAEQSRQTVANLSTKPKDFKCRIIEKQSYWYVGW